MGFLQNNLGKAESVGRAIRKMLGHEQIIVKAQGWRHGGSLSCSLYFSICLNFSIIKHILKDFFHKQSDESFLLTHLQQCTHILCHSFHYPCSTVRETLCALGPIPSHLFKDIIPIILLFLTCIINYPLSTGSTPVIVLILLSFLS